MDERALQEIRDKAAAADASAVTDHFRVLREYLEVVAPDAVLALFDLVNARTAERDAALILLTSVSWSVDAGGLNTHASPYTDMEWIEARDAFLAKINAKAA